MVKWVERKLKAIDGLNVGDTFKFCKEGSVCTVEAYIRDNLVYSYTIPNSSNTYVEGQLLSSNTDRTLLVPSNEIEFAEIKSGDLLEISSTSGGFNTFKFLAITHPHVDADGDAFVNGFIDGYPKYLWKGTGHIKLISENNGTRLLKEFKDDNS